MSFAELWRELEPLGRTRSHRRLPPLLLDRGRRQLPCLVHRSGQQARPDRGAGQQRQPVGLVGAASTGRDRHWQPSGRSRGGGYDGALGVAATLAAVDNLKSKSFYPERPVAITVWTEEEGARFGVSCLGSRLLAGAIAPDAARALTDDAGLTLAAAMTTAGLDAQLSVPAMTSSRDRRLRRTARGAGRALAPLGAAVGVAEGIWPHGRWRLDFTGRPDHAGTAGLPTATTRCSRTRAPCSPPARPLSSTVPWLRSAR